MSTTSYRWPLRLGCPRTDRITGILSDVQQNLPEEASFDLLI